MAQVVAIGANRAQELPILQCPGDNDPVAFNATSCITITMTS